MTNYSLWTLAVMKNEDNSIVGSLDLNFMDNKHLFNIKKERVQKEPVSDVGK